MANVAKDLGNGVARLRLSSPCGLVVLVYVVRNGDRVALIDTGFGHTVPQLEQGLDELGLGLGEVTDVLYTHTHLDHMGGGVVLRERWDPRQFVWEGTAPALVDYYAHLESIRDNPRWPMNFLPDDGESRPVGAEIRQKPENPIRLTEHGTLGDIEWVALGDVVRVGELRFECVAAPGHDPYHVAWLERGKGWLFSGDVVLAVPTPLVTTLDSDTRAWLETLARWESDLDVGWLLPGHGMPTKLFTQSIQRSRSYHSKLRDALFQSLEMGTIHPLHVIRDVLPVDRSQFLYRTSVWLGNLELLLHELSSSGTTSLRDDLRWDLVGEFPVD